MFLRRAKSKMKTIKSQVAIIRRGQVSLIGKSLWIQHNTLMARKHVERGRIPGQWRRPSARKCAARPAPPEEPNVTRNTSAAPASTAVVPSPLPTPEVVPLASQLLQRGVSFQLRSISQSFFNHFASFFMFTR